MVIGSKEVSWVNKKQQKLLLILKNVLRVIRETMLKNNYFCFYDFV